MNDDSKEELKDCYARIERLEAALRPFAQYGTPGSFMSLDVETPVSIVVEPHVVWLEDALKIVDFHEARAALEERT